MLSIVGWASASKQESASEYIDGTVAAAKVEAAIVNEPTLTTSEINVETFKGIVQLSGFVADPGFANKAVSLPSEVKGVKSVKDDIRVK